jgi:DsbC/DsbD-like thiol-disulfide interchange protein
MKNSRFRAAAGLLCASFAIGCGSEPGRAPAEVVAGKPAAAPIRRPAPEVETTADLSGITVRGGIARLVLRVTLREGLHVQANQPRDPALIPTVLTVEPPVGTALLDVAYPAPVDFNQAGASQPLAVYPNVFDIVVRLKVEPGLAAATPVTGTLRYQACNEVLCYAPANASATWMLTIPET